MDQAQTLHKQQLEVLSRLTELQGTMTPHQVLFGEAYLRTWNGTRSAEEAGLIGDDHQLGIQGWTMLQNEKVCEYIHLRMISIQMSADEVLFRLALQARASAADFYSIGPNGQPTLDLIKAQREGYLGVLKKIKPTNQGWEIELYDAQAALVQLGKFHSLWVDIKVETEDVTGNTSVESLEDRAARVTALLEIARSRRDNTPPTSQPALEP